MRKREWFAAIPFSNYAKNCLFFYYYTIIFNKNQEKSLSNALKRAKTCPKVPSQHRQKQKVMGQEGGGRPGRRPNYGKIGARVKSR